MVWYGRDSGDGSLHLCGLFIEPLTATGAPSQTSTIPYHIDGGGCPDHICSFDSLRVTSTRVTKYRGLIVYKINPWMSSMTSSLPLTPQHTPPHVLCQHQQFIDILGALAWHGWPWCTHGDGVRSAVLFLATSYDLHPGVVF